MNEKTEFVERRIADPRTGKFPDTVKERNDLKRFFHRSCKTKIAYVSRDRAISAILEISAEEGKQTGIKPYRCAFGNHWHIGHDPADPTGGSR